MIVRIHRSGKSFAGTANYLTHDPKAQTAERVEWTHTMNLANDHVPCAVNEMLWTARDAELLKQEAGVRAGGGAIEKPVKHLSLNWAAEDNPSREHMLATTEQFLRQMGWQDHQAVVVAHNDKAHKHVHVMLNAVHHETGLSLNDDFDRRRAQAWALEYEREQGRIHCQQRLVDQEQREQSAPRNIWEAFQASEKEFGQAEQLLAENHPIDLEKPENRRNSEWRILKEHQRLERDAFFAAGKSEFSQLRKSIYQEVREEFRERWSEFYASRRDGADPAVLAAMKENILADQKVALDTWREAACKELRAGRDSEYRQLLADHREAKAELHWRQDLGLDNAGFLSDLSERSSASHDVTDAFRAAGAEITQGGADNPEPSSREEQAEMQDDPPRTIAGGGRNDDIGLRGFDLAGWVGSLFDQLINLGSTPQLVRPQRDASGRDPFEASAEQARAHQQHREREEAEDDERRRRQRVPYGD
jgi:hypothetical protein